MRKFLSLALALALCLSLALPALAADVIGINQGIEPDRYAVTRTGSGSFVEEKNTIYLADEEEYAPYEISGYYQITPDTTWTVTNTGTKKGSCSVDVWPLYKGADGCYHWPPYEGHTSPYVQLMTNGKFVYGSSAWQDVQTDMSPGESYTFTWADIKAGLDTMDFLPDTKESVLYALRAGSCWYFYAVSDDVPSTPSTPSTGFADVKDSDYFATPVAWAVEKGITEGTGNNAFSPNKTCNQGQILTFLWRAKGSPAPAQAPAGSEYYANPIQWASEQKLIGAVDPAAPCTRADVVSYLWKLAGSPEAKAADFTDVPAGADYAQAVAWAVENGVTEGTGNNTFSPDKTCTRGQIVTFLHRALAK